MNQSTPILTDNKSTIASNFDHIPFVKSTSIYDVVLNDKQIETAARFAKDAEIGGASNIRQGQDRAKSLSEDQIIGQLGECALSVYLTGDEYLYIKTREERNKNRYAGDNGSDLLGYKVDVKTSKARYGMSYKYNLWVRGREYHKETKYVLALVENDRYSIVHFAGWYLGHELPEPNFDGRREVNQENLRQMDINAIAGKIVAIIEKHAQIQHRPPLTVPPDEVQQGGFELAEDGTLTAYAAQRVTWVYRGEGMMNDSRHDD